MSLAKISTNTTTVFIKCIYKTIIIDVCIGIRGSTVSETLTSSSCN